VRLKFYSNENFHLGAVQQLRSLGYDVLTSLMSSTNVGFDSKFLLRQIMRLKHFYLPRNANGHDRHRLAKVPGAVG
jgi:hypothetical protein